MKAFGLFFVAVVLTAFLCIISALPVMLLWNWLVPSIFNLREIGFLEAWGLSWLCAALFKTSVSS